MGTNRYIIAKRDIRAGESLTDVGRAYHLTDLMDDQELYIELWRLIKLYDSDLDAFFEGIISWVEEVKNCGGRDMLFQICDEFSDLEWRDR